MPSLIRFPCLWALALACLALVACQASEPAAQPSPPASPAATPPLTLTSTPTSQPASASLLSGERAYGHVLALADDIGPRPAGSDAEEEAAQYISHQLSAYGYQAQVQEFSFEYYVEEAATLEVVAPEPLPLNPLALHRSARAEVTAEVVMAGLGRAQDFPAEGLKGHITLIERGELSFSDKVANATAAGAGGVIIYNNLEDIFRGELQEESSIPAVSLSRAEGLRLRAMLDEGPLTLRLSTQPAQETRTSQNVIGRPPEHDCRLVLGAHYDSVAAGPGANDNASGVATVLEIARVLDMTGQEEGVCFVAFGAEEVGLFGSRDFLTALTSQGEPTPEAMVNLDMLGVGDEWQLMGSPSLVDLIDQQAAALGLDPVPIGSHVQSDHLSFMDAGIPAILIHRFEDPRNHTESDRVQFIEPQLLQEAAELALLTLRQLEAP